MTFEFIAVCPYRPASLCPAPVAWILCVASPRPARCQRALATGALHQTPEREIFADLFVRGRFPSHTLLYSIPDFLRHDSFMDASDLNVTAHDPPCVQGIDQHSGKGLRCQLSPGGRGESERDDYLSYGFNGCEPARRNQLKCFAHQWRTLRIDL